ncbi:aromatic acid exporter family protein [Spongiactinospora sp. 9N601]|uniref:aromatic acid exporter family protein n=1 Tax=Spongiactinospora sp. 9N601 TaxID=3375149 RepID=UPI0037920961
MPQFAQTSRRVRPVLLATRRAQPTVVFIIRLTVTAVAAYLVALVLPLAEKPLLAPLTALLVVQYTLYQTIRSAIQRIASVVVGVLIAVLLAATVGFTWWTLGLAIATSLVIGYTARLGDHILEVPISAMLIFALGAATPAGAADRVFETLVEAGMGLLAGLIASPVHLETAQEAIGDLGCRLGELTDRLADGLWPGEYRAAREGEGPDFPALLRDARQVGRDIQRTDGALSRAEESLRLNPRAGGLHPMGTALRSGLETLEYSAVNLRGLARSLADRQHLQDGGVYAIEARDRLGAALREVSECMRAFGLLVRSEVVRDVRAYDEALRSHLAEGRRRRDEFADALAPWISARSAEWRLHAEVLVHLDRLLDLFDAEHRAQSRNRRRRRILHRIGAAAKSGGSERRPRAPVLRRPRPG